MAGNEAGDGDDVGADGEDVGADGDDVSAPARERMETAIRDVRREGWKVAITSAVVDASALFLGANLALTVAAPASVPDRVVLPRALTDPIGTAVGTTLGTVALPGSATVAGLVALLALVAGVGYRVRSPLVEQFEAANPGVEEKLRTARDATAADADSSMAARLYEDVLDDLQETSSLELIDGRRVALTAVAVVALSLATVQVAVLDVALVDRPAPESVNSSDRSRQNYTGLKDADAILGDREAVSAGEENQTARVESTGGGRDVGSDRRFPEDSGGAGIGDSGGAVDSQQAAFAAPERVEDAELVREYHRRIRSDDSEED